jgi:TetR/AcrR family transcriptional repressor of nem operon
VHERGFAGASVRDIVQAAGVPQGSFTNHFVSKEAFGLEVIDRYLADSEGMFRETLGNPALPPLERLRAYLEAGMKRPNGHDMRHGCLFGNFAAEASEHSEAMRRRLIDIFAEVQQRIADCLRAAVETGDLPPDFDCDEVAGFIVASLQGANLLAKTLRSPTPVERFGHILFSKVLR